MRFRRNDASRSVRLLTDHGSKLPFRCSHGSRAWRQRQTNSYTPATFSGTLPSYSSRKHAVRWIGRFFKNRKLYTVRLQGIFCVSTILVNMIPIVSTIDTRCLQYKLKSPDSAVWGRVPMVKLQTDGSRQPLDGFQSKNAHSSSLNERNRTMYHDPGVKICGKGNLIFSVFHPAALSWHLAMHEVDL